MVLFQIATTPRALNLDTTHLHADSVMRCPNKNWLRGHDLSLRILLSTHYGLVNILVTNALTEQYPASLDEVN